VELKGTLSDEEFDDPGSIPGMPSDWMPWSGIASKTYEHYEQHLKKG
jgi:hypothetical protein